MPVIKFKGYRTKIPNEFYVRHSPGFFEIDDCSSECLTVKRVKRPDMVSLITYIHHHVNQALTRRKDNQIPVANGDFDLFLLTIPTDGLEHLLTCEQFPEFVHTSMNYNPSLEHLGLRIGVLPKRMINAHHTARRYDNELGSNSFLRGPQGEIWRYELALTNGLLPPYDDIKVLLKHNVSKSETLTVSGVAPKIALKHTIEDIYTSLRTRGDIEQIPDRSDVVLDHCAHKVALEFILRSALFLPEPSEDSEPPYSQVPDN